MKCIECPKKYKPKPKEKVLFIAGGITECKNWEPELISLLKNEDIIILNPKRKKYEHNKKSEKEQINWEYKHMEKANMFSFWFPKETLCPITLYELGKISMTNSRLFIGIDQEYKRKSDIEIQTSLIRPEVEIVYSLKDLANQIKESLQ